MLLLEGISNIYKIKILVENCMSSLEKWQIDNDKNGWQSPIAFSNDNVVRKKLPPLQFGNYERKFNVSLRNTGHTVQLDLDTTDIDCDDLPVVSGGPLEFDYTLDHIHFHWDVEHTIDGHKYPLEAHLVHYKTSTGSFRNALKFNDGLAILAVFYDYGNCKENIFKEFVQGIEDVSRNVSCGVPVDGICFCGFLPNYVKSYYTYQGTFNAPGIHEVATWVVFSEPATIEKSQLEALSNIDTEENDHPPQKSSPVQEMNDPSIIYNGNFYAAVRKFIRDTRRYIWEAKGDN
ncbi:unnamed protein product [Phaedon cochleariae]|uniref:Alpha-carbonic anhydrase domain-containing protein n=1 Tax=Phaedon cochleariae TaxID=80249 RepID=A0A9P0DLU5_PHACE|nr:unnamed protein product [Phaedon cochleariae]